MLHKKMISETVLEVLDTEVTFGGVKRQYRYYDIVNWNELKHPSTVNFKMSEKLIAWVKSFYLHDVQPYQGSNTK